MATAKSCAQTPGLGRVACAAALAATVACAGSAPPPASPAPAVRTTPFDVMRAVARGPYVDVALHGESRAVRAFVSGTAGCRTRLVPGAPVRLAERGGESWIEAGAGVRCRLHGLSIGALEQWHGPHVLPVSSLAKPRGGFAFDPVYADPDVLFLQRRPSADPSAGRDRALLFVVPNQGACRSLASGADVGLESRAKPYLALALVRGASRCPLLAVIRVPLRR